MEFDFGKMFKKGIKGLVLFLLASLVANIPIFNVPIIDLLQDLLSWFKLNYPNVAGATLYALILMAFNWLDVNWLSNIKIGKIDMQKILH